MAILRRKSGMQSVTWNRSAQRRSLFQGTAKRKCTCGYFLSQVQLWAWSHLFQPSLEFADVVLDPFDVGSGGGSRK